MLAYIDCSGGFNETMLLGALLDLGFPLTSLEAVLAPTGLLQRYQLQLSVCAVAGQQGFRFSVSSEVGEISALSLTLSSFQDLLTASMLSISVQQRLLTICRDLAEVGIQFAPEQVDPLSYPLGNVEALIALIGCVLGLEVLAITQFYATPLPLTHGSLQENSSPTLSPVTLELLRRVSAPWQPCFYPVEKELVTPLGAALLATLAGFTPPALHIERVGYGCSPDEALLPGSLRLCLGQPYQMSTPSTQPEPVVEMNTIECMETDWVTVIESHIDNMSGELLGGLMERLFTAGALDVTYTPIQMKKNRPATHLTILVPPAIGEQMAFIVLQETTTLGVRIQQVRRLKAQRYQVTLSTSLGPLQVKVKRLGTRIISASPEYEDCQRLANDHNLPLIEVYEIAHQAIQDMLHTL